MGKRAEKIKSHLKHVREKIVERVDSAARAAEKIVEEGSVVAHHNVPTTQRMLPFPIGHCPLSSQPLYLPPSIERPQSQLLKKLGREMKKCLLKAAEKISARSIKDLEEFADSKKQD